MIVVLALSIALSPPVFAKSCAQVDLPTEIANADAIVAGRFIERSVLRRFEVDQVYKGRVHRTITIIETDYDVPSAAHTLYLHATVGGYVVRLCGASHPGYPTERERALLAAPDPPDPDELVLGTAGNAVAVAGGAIALITWAIMRSRRLRARYPRPTMGEGEESEGTPREDR